MHGPPLKYTNLLCYVPVFLVIKIIGGEEPGTKPVIIGTFQWVLTGEPWQVYMVLQHHNITNLQTLAIKTCCARFVFSYREHIVETSPCICNYQVLHTYQLHHSHRHSSLIYYKGY